MSVVGAEAMFYAYTSFHYMERPALELEKRRQRADDEEKRHFLEANPQFTGLLPKDLFQSDSAVYQVVLRHGFLPLGHGIPHAPLIYCNEGYGFLKYVTDRYGLHNDDAVWEAKSPWLLIGDSFVHGACVPTDKNIASRLMQKTGATVINLGSGGNGPDRYVALARVFIPLTKPEKVVLIFYENDFDAMASSPFVDQPSLLAPYLNGNFAQETAPFYADIRIFMEQERARFLTRVSRQVEKGLKKFRAHAVRILGLRDVRDLLLGSGETFNYVQLAVQTTVDACRKLAPACDVTVAYIPPSEFYRPRAARFIDAQASYLRKVVADVGGNVTFVDYSGLLTRESYAPQGPHLSIEGYEFVAKRIIEAANPSGRTGSTVLPRPPH